MSDKLKNWCETNDLPFSKFKASNLTLKEIASTKTTQVSVLAEDLGLTSKERGLLMDAVKTLQNMDQDDDDNVGLYDDPEVIVKGGNDSADYNEFENDAYDDDDKDEKSIHEESFMLRSNFSDDPADQWDIVQFFDRNEKFNKFKPILLLQMQIQNSANYNGNDGMGGNQNDQLDHLLDTMLGSGNQNDSSSDSDEDIYTMHQDVHTFREYIQMGYMPSPNSLIYDVILNEYEFDEAKSTRNDLRDDELDEKAPFATQIHYAQVLDYKESGAKTDRKQHFITVGLDCNLNKNETKRDKINLVVVLETSSSMNDAYYHSADSKQVVANNIVCGILEQLQTDDKFCLVTFNDTFHIEQPLDDVQSMEMDEMRKQILDIECSSAGCDWDEGYNAALGQLQELFDAQVMAAVNQTDDDESEEDEFENRVILITNSLPDSDSSILDLMQVYSDSDENKIYTSFVNIGDQPNAKLINAVHKLRGCNIKNYLLDSKQNVLEQIKNEFYGLINPVFFNVSLSLNACKMDTIYGYHNNMRKIAKLNATGSVQHKHSWFLTEGSATDKEMVSMRLQAPDDDDEEMEFEVCVDYEDKKGQNGQCKRNVVLSRNKELGIVDDEDDTYYDDEAMRKRIVLIKYVELMNEWLAKDSNNDDTNLNVSEEYQKQFEIFLAYFKRQTNEMNDDKLKEEEEILNTLIQFDATKAEELRKSSST